ncbi:MAG TPA: ABC transporter permease [bacterium]|nr:ABC transporter permease [bacterium]
MFKVYLKIILRNFLKERSFVWINLIGLSVGLLCCFTILLYARKELAYENFHVNKDHIYRVLPRIQGGANDYEQIWTPAWLAPSAKNKIPEIRLASRYIHLGSEQLITHENQRMLTDGLALADPDFLHMFSFTEPFTSDMNPLSDPSALIVSRSAAYRIFGDQSPIGKTITLNGSHVFTIKAVFTDVPVESHLQFEMLGNFQRIREIWGMNTTPEENTSWNFATYLMTTPQADISAVQSKVLNIFEERAPRKNQRTVRLQSLNDIHFTQGIRRDNADGNWTSLIALCSVAVLVVLIACFNFTNLMTAKAMRRAKEIAVRKISGASRWLIALQFISEALMLSVFATVLAIGMLEGLLPLLRHYLDISIPFTYTEHGHWLGIMIGVGILTGLIAGFYPAWVLSSFEPARTLKGVAKLPAANKLRKGLVLSQFTVSIILASCTVIVWQQINHMKEFNLGFQKEQIIVISAPGSLREKPETVRQQLTNDGSIISVTFANSVPGNAFSHGPYEILGGTENGRISINTIYADAEYLKTLNIALSEGRYFYPEHAAENTDYYVVNEAFMKAYGKSDFQTMRLRSLDGNHDKPGLIVGIVKDFHYASLKSAIAPLVLRYAPAESWRMIIRVAPQRTKQAITKLSSVWQTMAPEIPMTYRFLDEVFDKQYKQEDRLHHLMIGFSALAILIAGLGLYSMVAYYNEQRTKEIGIRKVLGATITDVLYLMSRDYVGMVILANIISFPLIYFMMNHWLDDFAYRVTVRWEIMAITGILTLGLTLIMVGIQSWRTASANPIHALKYE